MNTQRVQRMRSQQIEALKIQQKYMQVVQERHRAWSTEAEPEDLNLIRKEIIDLIEKTLAQYDQLLEGLRRPVEED